MFYISLNDDYTKGIILIGEIVGQAEEDAAKFLPECNVGPIAIPVVAYRADVTAPLGRSTCHAGAIISGVKGKAVGKINSLNEIGVQIAERDKRCLILWRRVTWNKS